MRKKRTYREEKRKKIYLTIGILFFFVLLLAVFYQTRKLTFLEKGMKDAFYWVQSIFVKQEKGQTSSCDFNETMITSLKEEIEVLKKELELKTSHHDYEMISATVINRNMDGWFHELTIDKGSKDGIEVGMAVTTSGGLIGEIKTVSNHVSVIALLTTETLGKKAIRIQTEKGSIQGILMSYDTEKKAFIVGGIAGNEEIRKGNFVVTSGLGSTYPEGILIGQIESITTDQFDLAKTVEVKPFGSFDHIQFVSVLKRKIAND